MGEHDIKLLELFYFKLIKDALNILSTKHQIANVILR